MSGKLKSVNREQICGFILIVGLSVLFLNVIGIRFLNVSVKNIKADGKGLFSIITDKGTVNISSGDIIRIVKTYTKEGIAGTPVELDKIYTNKGFAYFSSTNTYAKAGRQLVNSVDFTGQNTWSLPGESPAANLALAKSYNYVIDTPGHFIPVLSFLLNLEHYLLAIMAVALLLLIVPLQPKL